MHEKIKIESKNSNIRPKIIFDNFTTAIKWVNFSFKVKSSAMKILKQKNKDINLKFIFYQMQIQEVNHTTHKRYYLSVYQKLDFVFPSLTTQQKIVSEIESKFSIIGKVEEIVNNSLNKTEQLRKSILKVAFEGRLVK